MKIAFLQTFVWKDSAKTIERASNAIRNAVETHPDVRVVVLPESFNCPYGPEFFPKYSEPVPNGKTCQMLATMAKDLGVYIIGGSIIEVDESKKLYNTCTVWSPQGKLIGKHRKVHLFDINVISEGGGVQFQESAVLTPGKDFTIVQIDDRKFGIGICHDIRFEEMAKVYRKEGCDMIIYPSAFCICQGPMYWELLQRARAADNQVFVASISCARDTSADYVAYGHTMLVDPWGRVLHEAGADEEMIVADVDFGQVDSVREQIPIFDQRRTDLYETKRLK